MDIPISWPVMAKQQHASVRLRYRFRRLKHRLECGALADEFFEMVFRFNLLDQVQVLLFQTISKRGDFLIGQHVFDSQRNLFGDFG
jgi:hypothetical protein